MSGAFSGKNKDHIYLRLSNPTNSVFEEKIALLENGKAGVVMASGMAAVTNTCMALLRSGDEFIAHSSLFMSTYLRLSRLGWTQGQIADAVGISQNRVSEIIGNANFCIIDTLLAQGREMSYVAADELCGNDRQFFIVIIIAFA